MGGIHAKNSTPIVPLNPSDYARAPEAKASRSTLAATARGAAIGAAAGFVSLAPTGVVPAMIASAVAGALVGGATVHGIEERTNKRDRPLLISDHGRETTVFVSEKQWSAIKDGIKSGYQYQGVPVEQFAGHLPPAVATR